MTAILGAICQLHAPLETCNLSDKESNDKFFKACKNGDLDTVKLLIKTIPDIEANNNYALTLAVYYGHYKIVKFLVENGANIEESNAICLYLKYASKNGYLEIMKLLIDHGADVQTENNWAIRSASVHNHLDIVKLLIEHGANIHDYDEFSVIRACDCGNLEVVKLLIEHGADINYKNNIALQFASLNGHLEVVKLLIEKGANVTDDNNLAITLANKNGHLEVVQLLTLHGGIIDNKFNKSNSKNIEILIRSGANIKGIESNISNQDSSCIIS